MVFVLSAMSPGPRACTTHASDANATFGAAPGNLRFLRPGLAVAEVETINRYHPCVEHAESSEANIAGSKRVCRAALQDP
jgi:hypothetical protein